MAQARTAAETFAQLGTRLTPRSRRSADGPRCDRRGTVENCVKILELIVVDFRGNPWVQVKGFKIKLGFPPSIELDVEVPQNSQARRRSTLMHPRRSAAAQQDDALRSRRSPAGKKSYAVPCPARRCGEFRDKTCT